MFKYMDNYYLESNQSIVEKFFKVKEEYEEVFEEFAMNNNSKSDLAQELLDLILASKNMLRKMQDEELINIGTETFNHRVKLNTYLETGKYRK